MEEAEEEDGPPCRIQVVVRVRPILPHEELSDVAVTCSQDGTKVQASGKHAAGRRWSAARRSISDDTSTPLINYIPLPTARQLSAPPWPPACRQVLVPERDASKPLTASSPGARGARGTSGGGGASGGGGGGGGGGGAARLYEFDACLPGGTGQAQLFDVCGADELVEAALDGYSTTVFAFGQTGSGKTHTIVGPRLARLAAAAGEPPQSPQQQQRTGRASAAGGGEGGPGGLVGEEDGLLPRCIEALFRWASGGEGWVRQDPRTGSFYAAGLTQRRVGCGADALAGMAAALAARHTRAHRLNACSSRSHCIMSFVVHSEDRSGDGAGGRGVRRCGRLTLVDLAGSERLRDTGGGAGGGGGRAALRETGHINKSLFTLGQVLSALSARGAAAAGHSHVPFRDARLTQLLWDGLRGGGRALMVACLAPLRGAAGESANTLHFAGMALRVRGAPVVTANPQARRRRPACPGAVCVCLGLGMGDQAVLELRATVRALRVDICSLAGALHAVGQPGADVPAVLGSLPPSLVQDAMRAGVAGSAPAGDQGGGRGRGGGARAARATASGRSGRAPAGLLSTTGLAASHPGISGVSSPAGGSERSPSPLASDSGGWPRGEQRRRGAKQPAAAARSSRLRRARSRRRRGRRRRAGPRARGASLLLGAGAFEGGGGGGGRKARQQPGVEDLPLSAFPELAAMEAAFQRGDGRLLAAPGVGGGGSGGGGGGLGYGSLGGAAAGARAILLAASAGSLPPVTLLPRTLAGSAALPASLSHPRSLLPVRTSVSSLPGALHGRSAVQVAAAAAEAGVRPAPTRAAAHQHPAHQHQQQEAAAAAPEPSALSWAQRNPWFGADEGLSAAAYVAHDDLVAVGVDPTTPEYFSGIERAAAAAHPDVWAAWQQRAAHEAAGGAGAGLRVSLKDATPAGGGALLASAAGLRQQTQQPPPQGRGSAAAARLQAAAPARGSPQPQAPGRELQDVLRFAAAAGGGGGGGVWALAPPACGAGYGGGYGAPAVASAADARREYAAARQQVIDELRRAREEAERQRRAILMQFGRAVGRQWV
ncbi:MAG: hypothetical protein J3K34DRAFT_513527 [Monoraphidium minutum]|nr:MAG: hypothetical protein J3K34DRAFT_513527 [Monoraphidium minutum]